MATAVMRTYMICNSAWSGFGLKLHIQRFGCDTCAGTEHKLSFGLWTVLATADVLATRNLDG